MLHTKYQESGPSSYGQEDFQRFPYISLCKNKRPPVPGRFGPQGHNVNNLDRGLLDNVTRQISKL